MIYGTPSGVRAKRFSGETMDPLVFLKPALDVCSRAYSGVRGWMRRGWQSKVVIDARLGDAEPGEWRSCELHIKNDEAFDVRLTSIRATAPKGLLLAPAEHQFGTNPKEDQAGSKIGINWEVESHKRNTLKIFLRRPVISKTSTTTRAAELEISALSLNNEQKKFPIWVWTPVVTWE
jgi:hypothetical protein